MGSTGPQGGQSPACRGVTVTAPILAARTSRGPDPRSVAATHAIQVLQAHEDPPARVDPECDDAQQEPNEEIAEACLSTPAQSSTLDVPARARVGPPAAPSYPHSFTPPSPCWSKYDADLARCTAAVVCPWSSTARRTLIRSETAVERHRVAARHQQARELRRELVAQLDRRSDLGLGPRRRRTRRAPARRTQRPERPIAQQPPMLRASTAPALLGRRRRLSGRPPVGTAGCSPAPTDCAPSPSAPYGGCVSAEAGETAGGRELLFPVAQVLRRPSATWPSIATGMPSWSPLRSLARLLRRFGMTPTGRSAGHERAARPDRDAARSPRSLFPARQGARYSFTG